MKPYATIAELRRIADNLGPVDKELMQSAIDELERRRNIRARLLQNEHRQTKSNEA